MTMEDFNFIKTFIINEKIKSLKKIVNDEDKQMLNNLLLKYQIIKVECINESNQRLCKKCNEIKDINDFVFNTIGLKGESNFKKVRGFICKKCHDKDVIYNDLFNVINQTLNEINEIPITKIKNKLKFLASKADDLYENNKDMENTEDLINNLDNLISEMYDYYVSNGTHKYTSDYNTELINKIITNDIIELFLFFKELRRKLNQTKLQGGKNETS